MLQIKYLKKYDYFQELVQRPLDNKIALHITETHKATAYSKMKLETMSLILTRFANATRSEQVQLNLDSSMAQTA